MDKVNRENFVFIISPLSYSLYYKKLFHSGLLILNSMSVCTSF